MENKYNLPFCYLEVTAELINDVLMNNIVSVTAIIGVFLCERGQLDVSIDSKRYYISKGDMFIYTPSQYARIISMSDDFYGILIQTDYDYVIPMVNKVADVRTQLSIRENPSIKLSDDEYDKILHFVDMLKQRIEQEYSNENDKLKKKILRELVLSLGETFMLEILNIYFSSIHIEPSQLDNGDILVQNFIIDLYQHYKREREVSFYAQKQCFSASHFSAVIKKKTGKSASQWIIEMVLLDAKQMLRYSALSIKEISTRLNFPTQSFFGKYFKQYVGISPKEYRNSVE